jgi:hypothetical protein
MLLADYKSAAAADKSADLMLSENISEFFFINLTTISVTYVTLYSFESWNSYKIKN